MSDDLNDLKRDYRAITAPPQLATRVIARVAGSTTRPGFWMPAAVTCTAILALIWMLPFTGQVPSDIAASHGKPSIPTLTSVRPSKPKSSVPSMTQLRSVSVPIMPSKPKPAAVSKSQTTYQIENETLKEKHDAYI